MFSLRKHVIWSFIYDHVWSGSLVCGSSTLQGGGGGGGGEWVQSQILKKNRSKYCFLNKRTVGLIAPAYIIDFLATENLPKSVQTLLQITHLASRKSYLVIMCPNSHEYLTKIKIRSHWSWFKHCSKSLT